MFDLALMWVIGAIVAAADLFETMISLAEVWIKGALSTAVIILIFAAPLLVVREMLDVLGPHIDWIAITSGGSGVR